MQIVKHTPNAKFEIEKIEPRDTDPTQDWFRVTITVEDVNVAVGNFSRNGIKVLTEALTEALAQ